MDANDSAERAHKPLYTRPMAARLAGMSDGQLRGILDRRLIELTEHNPGKGNQRLFTTLDVIKIAAAKALSDIRVPMRLLQLAGRLIETRALELLPINVPSAAVASEYKRRALSSRYAWLLFPLDGPDGEWSVLVIDDQHPAPEPNKFVPSYCVLEIDVVIGDCLDRLLAHDRGDHDLPDNDFRRSFKTAALGMKALL